MVVICLFPEDVLVLSTARRFSVVLDAAVASVGATHQRAVLANPVPTPTEPAGLAALTGFSGFLGYFRPRRITAVSEGAGVRNRRLLTTKDRCATETTAQRAERMYSSMVRKTVSEPPSHTGFGSGCPGVGWYTHQRLPHGSSTRASVSDP